MGIPFPPADTAVDPESFPPKPKPHWSQPAGPPIRAWRTRDVHVYFGICQQDENVDVEEFYEVLQRFWYKVVTPSWSEEGCELFCF